MDKKILETIHADKIKKRPDVKVGDSVKVHVKIDPTDESRIQIFEGNVIAVKGTGLDKTITVRKVSYGVGVERIFPYHSPVVAKIEVVKRGTPKRSKLYYLRNRVGRMAMRISSHSDVYFTDEEDLPAEVATEEQGEDKNKVETEVKVDKNEDKEAEK
jgi:large subunit ribosomal protein L19